MSQLCQMSQQRQLSQQIDAKCHNNAKCHELHIIVESEIFDHFATFGVVTFRVAVFATVVTFVTFDVDLLHHLTL